MSTYSFLDTQCSLTGSGGVVDLGYGAAIADEGITIAMAGDKNTMIIGADGEGMHSLHCDNSGQITVRLLKTSPSNQKLMNMYNSQKGSSKAWGNNTITLNNTASGDNITGQKCAFKKVPDFVNAKDGGIVEWTFDAIKIDEMLGAF